jgi:hypothetical protein
MKTPALRKALKGATVEIIIERERNITDIMSAAINVYYSGMEGSKTCLVSVHAQANDWMHPRGMKESSKDRSLMALTGVGGFYACHIKARFDLGDYYGSSYEKADRVTTFFKVVKPVMEEYRKDYPDCELSRLILALAELGATVSKTTVDNLDPANWNSRR